MPPPLPLPLFRIWTSDCRRYFPSKGTLQASPTTPQPPSASCFRKDRSGTLNVFLESIIAWPIITFSLESHEQVLSAAKVSNALKSETGEDYSQTFRPGVEQVDDPLLAPLGINELGKLWIGRRDAYLTTASPFTVPTMRTSDSYRFRCRHNTSVGSQSNGLRNIIRSPDTTACH